MSTKFEAFVEALDALCRAHRVELSTSGYDHLQIWDLDEGDAPIHGRERIEDMTDPGSAATHTAHVVGQLVAIGDLQIDDLQKVELPRIVMKVHAGRMMMVCGLTRDECRGLAPALMNQVFLHIQANADQT